MSAVIFENRNVKVMSAVIFENRMSYSSASRREQTVLLAQEAKDSRTQNSSAQR